MADKGGLFQAPVQSWNVSFYDDQSKTWLYGSLDLCCTALYFSSNPDQPSQKSLCIEFSYVKSVNKTLSSFLFGAITIITNDGQTFWFSSFVDRHSSFLIIQHFLKAFLCSPVKTNEGTSDSSTVSGGRTKLGSEILKSAYDSHKTLADAGSQLVLQGEKLANSAVTIQGIHENLTVAENLTGGLESWLGRWRMPVTRKFEELIVVNSNDIPDVLDVEVLCCLLSVNKFGPRKSCVLRVGKEGVTILDLKQKIINHFKWPDISRIRVVTPWEILVTRYLIGQPDLSYSIIYESMPSVLRMLERFASKKLEYLNPPEQKVLPGRQISHCHEKDQCKSSTSSSDSSEQVIDAGQPNPDIGSQLKKNGPQKVISDAEVSELTSVLGSIKSLALDVQKEQDAQLKSIGHLTDSVAEADARQKKLDFRTKRLL